MLIIEGPDGAGKTTLVELFKEVGIPQAPRAVASDTRSLTDLSAYVDHSLDQGFHHLVYDRHSLISAPIYGPMLRGHSPEHFGHLAWLGPRIRRLYQLQPIIIYCLPPRMVVMDNVRDDPNNKVVIEDIPAIYDQYVAKAAVDEALGLYTGTTIKVWDYTQSPRIDNKPSWFNRVVGELKGRSDV